MPHSPHSDIVPIFLVGQIYLPQPLNVSLNHTCSIWFIYIIYSICLVVSTYFDTGLIKMLVLISKTWQENYYGIHFYSLSSETCLIY